MCIHYVVMSICVYSVCNYVFVSYVYFHSEKKSISYRMLVEEGGVVDELEPEH